MIVLSRSKNAAGRPWGARWERPAGAAAERAAEGAVTGAPSGAPDTGTASDGRPLFVSMGTLGPPVRSILQHVGLTLRQGGYGESRKRTGDPPIAGRGSRLIPPEPGPLEPLAIPPGQGLHPFQRVLRPRIRVATRRFPCTSAPSERSCTGRGEKGDAVRRRWDRLGMS